MGAQLSKGGVAAEGKATADPAAAKANGQVSTVGLDVLSVSGEPHGTNSPWQHGCRGRARGCDGGLVVAPSHSPADSRFKPM